MLHAISSFPLHRSFRIFAARTFAAAPATPAGDISNPNIRIPAAAWSHIKLSHTLWSEVVNKGDIVIDATCGKILLIVLLSIAIFNRIITTPQGTDMIALLWHSLPSRLQTVL